MLIRRIQSQCKEPVCCIGTSATMVSVGSASSQRSEVARVASTVFGRPFGPDQIVDETLAPSLDGTGDAAFPTGAIGGHRGGDRRPTQVKPNFVSIQWRSGSKTASHSKSVAGA